MSDTSSGDILMFFAPDTPENALAAELQSQFETSDRLMQNFRPGFCFEVEDFAFSIELADDEGVARDEDEPGSYGRWRSLPADEPKPDPPFKAEPQDVTITRAIDKASPELLTHCLIPRRFEHAALVKRARYGATGKLIPILRMNFRKVWIKSVNWKDGDTVKETIKFKFADVDVTYVRRKPDGSVASTWNCAWAGVKNA